MSYDPMDYHDPTRGIGGAPPARSALGLRMILAAFGLVVCAAGAVAFGLIGQTALVVVMVLLAVAAAVDLVVVVRRRRLERRPR